MGMKKQNENFTFRSFLKRQNSKRIDSVVKLLDREIRARIDCTKCGNCCKLLKIRISDFEIDELSIIHNITKSDYVSRFVDVDDIDDQKYFKDTPC